MSLAGSTSVRALERRDLDLRSATGTSAVLRRVRDAEQPPVDADAVLIVTGFGQSMCDLAAVAARLAWSGLVTYRFDVFDHVGVAGGSIERFTVSGQLAALQAALKHIHEHEHEGVSVIAFSLGLRVALRAAAQGGGISRLLGVSGVVDLRASLERALGYDPDGPLESLPRESTFEGHTVRREPFLTDLREGGWLHDEPGGGDVPLMLLVGADDAWVTQQDCLRLTGSWRGAAELVTLAHITHHVGRHRTVFLRLIDDLTAWSLGRPLGSALPLAVPIGAVIEHAVAERRADRRAARSVAQQPSSLTRR